MNSALTATARPNTVFNPSLAASSEPLDAYWAQPSEVSPKRFLAAQQDPGMVAQPWFGRLVRIHLPPFGDREPFFSELGPFSRSGDRFEARKRALITERFVQPARAQCASDLTDAILEGLLVSGGSFDEPTRFLAHDLLRYRGRPLRALPFYARRMLLEQAFAEALDSGQAQPSHWRLVWLKPGPIDPPMHQTLSNNWGPDRVLRRWDAPYHPVRPAILREVRPTTPGSRR
jgi:hypothetical protein